MRITSGTTDQVIYFKAVLTTTDPLAGVTGLSNFTVYRSRNGGAATAMTTPTVTEVDSSNMPGIYKLLLDEDMTIGSGNDTEEMIFYISASGMDDTERVIELYRPKLTEGYTATVDSNGRMDISLIEGSDATDQINAAADAAIADAALATAAGLATAQADLDTLTGADGATLATSQPNYAPATASALATAQSDLDTITGADGVTLATTQGNYAPSTHSAADVRTEMDANSTQLAAIVADTNELQTDDIPTTLATLATSSALATAQADLDTLTGADGATLATSQPNYTPAVAGDAMALTTAERNATADAILTRQMTESYAANGVAPTTAQALFAIHQMLMDFGISGTNLTVKKLDDTSTAFVVTLNDSTNPTGAART